MAAKENTETVTLYGAYRGERLLSELWSDQDTAQRVADAINTASRDARLEDVEEARVMQVTAERTTTYSRPHVVPEVKPSTGEGEQPGPDGVWGSDSTQGGE